MGKLVKKWWFWVIIVIILLILGIIIFNIIINIGKKSYERLEINIKENMTNEDYCRIVFNGSGINLSYRYETKVYAKWHNKSTIDISLGYSSSCLNEPNFYIKVKDNHIIINDTFLSKIKSYFSPQVNCVFSFCKILRIKDMPNKDYNITFIGKHFHLRSNECPDSCPTYSPPAPGWCKNGTIMPGEVDECGCKGHPTCI